MTALLKQRLVGAIVLISLAIIFIPMLLTGKGELTTGEVPTNIPPKPLYEIQAPAVLPLEPKSASESVMEPLPDNAVAKTPGIKSQTPPDASAPAGKEAESISEKTQATVPTTTLKTDEKVVAKADATLTESKKADIVQTTPAESISAPVKPAPTPKEEKAETAPIKPPIVSGWVVQLGSFSREKNALKLRDSLRKNGHASFVEAYEHAGKTSYRVRVGPELTRELAEELKKQLQQETKLDGLVMSFPG